MQRMRIRLALAAAMAIPTPLFAQDAAQLTTAAESIDAAEIARYVSVIADDSMLGRDTPSPGLEKTAQYVADQFAQAGLRPAASDGLWIQRYRLLPRLNVARSYITFAAGDRKAVAGFATAARLMNGEGPEHTPPAGAIVIAGRHTGRSLAQLNLQNKVVLYVPPVQGRWQADRAERFDAAAEISQQAAGLVILGASDSARFARGLYAWQQNADVRASSRWAATVRPENVGGLRDIFTAVGLDLARLRSDTTPIARELPPLQVSVDLQVIRMADDSARAQNVVGVLEGTDTALRGRFVVFVAHMDNTGITRGRPDSINNGADDNASGVAGLLALAKALGRSGIRPARSLVFLASSGGTKGMVGTRAFMAPFDYLARMRKSGWAFTASSAEKTKDSTAHVEIAFGHIAAVINLDRIGRSHGDTIMIGGLDETNFATPPAWMATRHPELRLTAVDGGSVSAPTSDHYVFYEHRVPSLYFHSSVDPDDSTSAGNDSPQAVDAEWVARVARLALYVGYDVADAKAFPGWSREGRRAFLQQATDP